MRPIARLRRLTWLLLVPLAAAIVSMLAPSARAGDLPPTVIATLDHAPIPVERFAAALRETGVSLAALDPEDRDRLKREMLQEVIEQELLLREARDRGIRVPDADVARAIAQARADASPGEFAAVLEERGLTVAGWERRLRENLTLSRVLASLVPPVAAPTDAELKAYYDGHPDEFVEPEAVDARQIVVATEAEAAAARARLLAGASFDELAATQSTAPEAAEGGRLGFVQRGHVPDGFEIVFSLKPGDISPVVHTPFGYHLFTVGARRPATRLAYVDVAPELRERLLRTRQDEAVAAWIRARTSKAAIVINEPVLAGFDGRPAP